MLAITKAQAVVGHPKSDATLPVVKPILGALQQFGKLLETVGVVLVCGNVNVETAGTLALLPDALVPTALLHTAAGLRHRVVIDFEVNLSPVATDTVTDLTGVIAGVILAGLDDLQGSHKFLFFPRRLG